MYRHGVDVEKIKALEKCGWSTERIAAEMHMEPEAVLEAVSEYTERNKDTAPVQEGSVGTERREIAIVSLTHDQLNDICEKAAAIGAKEALKTFKQEQKKENSSRADRRLRNTKLLLRNYHMLKEHAQNSVFGRTQMEESALDILESMMSLYDNEVIIESIKRSATRTAVIVSHIETMFGLFAAYCDRSLNRDIDMRRYDILWDTYMAEDTLSVEEIAKKQQISIRIVYKDINIATEKLSALIFGVDGLKMH